jgi:Ca2+-binding EF-hand superfamily protein
MDANTGIYRKYQQPVKVSENSSPSILSLIVANDSMGGKYFATMDTNYCVCLFKKDYYMGDTTKPIEWLFYGKILSHEIAITSIAFGESLDENENTKLRLFSIGKDRRIFEYDIYNSSQQSGLVVQTMFKIEKEAHPSACIWYPKVDTKEDLLLTANDDYKMKIWNVSTKNSRRTCLGPTYGGEIVKLKKLDIDNNPDKYLVYATKKKVIGLIKMPLDGNPNKTMGLIAHPSDVEDICTTSDGRYLFTCGGEDLAVNMWSIDVTPIDQAIALGGDGIEPFINLIEGGREGQTYQDMKDFFYYSMIRSKDENTTKARRLNGRVPLEELPNLMRAMGYYPTQQEVDNMKDEVKFSNFAETGQHVIDVDLNTFIKLFVNHRPVYGIGKNNIQDAFAALMNAADGRGPALNRDDLLRLLREEGEYMGQQEMEESLNLLVGDSNFKTALPQEIQADDFAENILGFEEVEEVEGEEGGDEMGASAGFNGNNGAGQGGMSGGFGAMGVIPEEAH